MKNNIRYTITEKDTKRLIIDSSMGFEFSEGMTCEVLKKTIIDSIGMLKILNLESSTLKFSNKELLENEIITNKSGYKLSIVISEKNKSELRLPKELTK